jgi:hypothetical protein
MKPSVLRIAITILVATASTITAEEPRFPKVDGGLVVGKFLDLDDGARVYIRFASNSDSGAEVTREAKDGSIAWRYYVKPLMVAHSSYRHDVSAYARDGKLYVTSVGFKTIEEVIDLAIGGQLSRRVTKQGEQAGTGQPATAPESKPEGRENPKPESEPAAR